MSVTPSGYGPVVAYRAFSYLLQQTVRQAGAFGTLLDAQRELYNAALEERRGVWRWERRRVTRYEQYRTLTGLREVRASCINGKLQAHNLSGRARLSTINGRLDARFEKLAGSVLELNSVNGSVELTIPSDSKAEIDASTVSGGIDNDFGLHVNHHRFVGHDLRGELAGGGTRIELKNVNGRIEVRHAEDGRALSPVKDLGHQDRDKDDDDDSEI